MVCKSGRHRRRAVRIPKQAVLEFAGATISSSEDLPIDEWRDIGCRYTHCHDCGLQNDVHDVELINTIIRARKAMRPSDQKTSCIAGRSIEVVREIMTESASFGEGRTPYP
eukprot:756454-Karenia_brevis.AAC.1